VEISKTVEPLLRHMTLGKKGGIVALQSIRDKSIEEILENVLGLAAVASQAEVKSVMAVIAKCTIDLGENLAETSKQIQEFNSSTTALTKQVIRLNRVLTWATIVIAAATLAAAVTAIITALKS